MEVHTHEPWLVSLDNQGLFEIIARGEQGTDTIAMMAGEDDLGINPEANARRIAAAVNACAGIPALALEQGVIAEMREAIAELLIKAHPHFITVEQREQYKNLLGRAAYPSAIKKMESD
jgi:hypothetical protein